MALRKRKGGNPVQDGDKTLATSEAVEDGVVEAEVEAEEIGDAELEAEESVEVEAEDAELEAEETEVEVEAEDADAELEEPEADEVDTEPEVVDEEASEPDADEIDGADAEADAEPEVAEPELDFVAPESDEMPNIFVSETAGVAATLVSPTASPSAHLAPAPVKEREEKNNVLMTVLVSVIGAVLLVTGVGGVGALYFQGHAKPGTQLAGRDITGFTESQVRDVTLTLVENYTVTLELGGHQVEAKSQDLGLSFNVDQTVANAMKAGTDDDFLVRYNPFQPKNVPLVTTVDQEKLQDFLNETFIADEQRSVPANVAYDGDQAKFTVVPSEDGAQADAATVAQAIIEGQGFGSVLSVPTAPEPPEITNETAQGIADLANKQVKVPYVLMDGDNEYVIPAAQIASWLVFTQDTKNGTIVTSVDADKVQKDLPPLVTKAFTATAVTQKVLVGPDGSHLAVEKRGSDGTKVKDPDAVVSAVVKALNEGKGLSFEVPIVRDAYKTETVQMAPEYLKEHGARWVEVNRSNYTATRWEGTTKISTWSVVIGLPGTPTYAGVFHVWLKVPLQDMSGDDYLVEDVPWTAYFDGSIGLHGNYWVDYFGKPASHGCVGMPVSRAKVMYDWISVGDLVVVHD